MSVTVITPSRNGKCGFCNTSHHERCAVGVKDAAPREKHPNGSVTICTCDEGGCEPGRRKCTYCNNRVTDEVNPETWECFDVDACRAVVETRREANPLTRKLREAQENAQMAKIQESKEKAAKVEKTKEPTFCLVTGEPTKGGLFKPGMDARYVSERVADVTGKVRTEAQARKQMKDDGVSEKLIAKFDKGLALAKSKAEAKAAAEKAKAEAKKEKASA